MKSLTEEKKSVESDPMKTSKAKPLAHHGVRVDAKALAKCKALGINAGDVFRKALDHEILRVEGKCPTCGKKK